MALIGYARVSTRDQNPAAQEAELVDAGCVKVFVDRGESSRAENRPQWLACIDYLREGDVLVFRSLDRLAGTEAMAIEVLHQMGRRGVGVRSLTEPALNVDTSTPDGPGDRRHHGGVRAAPSQDHPGEHPPRPRSRAIPGSSRRSALRHDCREARRSARAPSGGPEPCLHRRRPRRRAIFGRPSAEPARLSAACRGAEFSGGAVSFDWAEFSGGAVVRDGEAFRGWPRAI